MKVERGDTLASIAAKYDTTWQEIARRNGLAPGTAPALGSVLRVVPGPGGWLAVRQEAKPAKSSSTAAPERHGHSQVVVDGGEDEYPELERAHAGGGKGLLFGSAGRGTPLEWPLYGELSSPYGSRGRQFHHGIDIRARKGTRVIAAGSGVVEFAGEQRGYGRMVVVRHGDLKTVYAHLASVRVRSGEAVTRMTEIGASGASGNATGPHLHFEIRNLENQSIDPVTVIAKDKLLSAAY